MHVYGQDWIWVKPASRDPQDIPFAAKILSGDKDSKLLVVDDEGKESWITKSQILKPIHTTSDVVEDMITMVELEEYSIMRNLYLRYKKKLIYTYVGSMLIAINPYEILPIYTKNEISFYKNQSSYSSGQPHIFAIGNIAYREMCLNKRNQCIVISGESGAGKTESTKLILQFLAAVSGKHSWIEQQVLDSNPILEAFGNARTIRNDNSSRFGKYIDIYFNENGSIEGAKIEHYLLEKSRIITCSKGERNYHIFYTMLAGLSKDEKRKLELEDASKYNYLISGGVTTCENRNDAEEFMSIRSAMKVLSFSDEEFWEVMKLLASILHLGNLKYKTTALQNLDDSCEITDNVNLTRIASFLGIQRHLLNDALVQKTIFAQGERVVTNLSKEQAIMARNAFVKAIYGKIFIMIVDKINKTIHRSSKKKQSIGVLDIFGFENFETNSFEQLCINFANENLQQFFVKHIFKLEQEEYTNEGINWENIKFVDNQDILEMIGLNSMSIMALINEETVFPKGSDLTLINKLHATHGSKSIYLKPKYENAIVFGIQHYAGEVFYDPNGFLEKNRDSFNMNLKELLMQSSNRFLLNLFKSEDTLDTTKKSITLSIQFRNSLVALMKTLLACDPSFVRCIKPNEVQKPNIIDRPLCVRQLRYSGMMETAKIRKAGFSIRHSYKSFVSRYSILVKGITSKMNSKTAAMKICSELFGQSPSDFALGKNKLFLKENQDKYLEQIRAELYTKAVEVIQRGFRRVLFRKFMKKYRDAAIIIQKNWRARGPRIRFLRMKRGFGRLQALIQSREENIKYQILRKNIVYFQARCRGYLTRRILMNKMSEKSRKMAELASLRIKEEQELKSAGHPRWKQEAETRYLARLATLNKELTIEKEKVIPQNNIDEESKVVDELFNFLTELQTPQMKPKSATRQKSQNTFREPEETDSSSGPIPLQSFENRYDHEDLSEYTFQKFAATYFMSNVSHQFSRKVIKNSLLDLPIFLQVSAQALWITILRFMGDLAEAKYEGENVEINSRQNVMQRITATLSKNSSMETKEFRGFLQNKHPEQKLLRATLRNINKLPKEFLMMIQNNEDLQQYQEWINTRSSNIDKLHFIIGHGILREELRDEIYCQILKQLTNNQSSISFKKGWILLSLCLGCFPPSEKFELYLRQYLRSGPTLFAPYCEQKLDRAVKNGCRKQPPSYLELKASKTKEPITVCVTLMNGQNLELEVDSSSTSEEICVSIAKSISLRDLLGFSLYITIENKVMSLGCEHQFLFDAISRCEQFSKEQGLPERTVKWQLFMQKEVFSPWHDATEDKIATDLIFHQIMKGINTGDYVCTSEKDLSMIAALCYYAEFGSNYDKKKMLLKLEQYLPKSLYRQSTILQWENLIQSAFYKSRCYREKLPQHSAKEDIVFFAKITWILKFSRFFEVLRIDDESGDPSQNVHILAFNWTGIYLIDAQENILIELSFPEISNVTFKKTDEFGASDSFTIITITSEILKFKSFDSSTIQKWLSYFLTQLKKRSTYVVAIRNFTKELTEGETETYLELKKGDLITLDQPSEKLQSSNSMWGIGSAGEKKGYFPIDSVIVLPCMMPPRKEIIDIYAKDGAKHATKQKGLYNTLQRQKMHTLRKFAENNFRPNIEIKSAYGTINNLRRARRELWIYSRDPIKSPLLMKLQGDSERTNVATQIFVLIMKYMGDLPQIKNALMNTDEIFEHALNDEILRDELYCQLMKQLTENFIVASEERGWDLIWLATGLFVPSQLLLKELQEFLKTRPHPIAKDSLQRLQKTMKSGNRKNPPYIVETEAIRQRSLKIYHKIYFPDDTDEAYQIESSTKAKDLIEEISKNFNLKSYEGFGLFVKIRDKVISVPEEFFIFDFIYDLLEWVKSNMPSRNNDQPVQLHYQLFFMKKLWINFTPGKDSVADESFYFYQELQKYLFGFFKITKSEAVEMAALVYRARFGMDKSKFQNQQGLLNQLIPDDLISEMKIDDWKKQIISSYSKRMELTESECKLEFLKLLEKRDTFGSTFFVVTQKTVSYYPEALLIAINRLGFHIIDPVKKNILKSYTFAELNFWSSGNTYFQITFGNLMGGSKLLCETSQGYKMDDLLSSYIHYYNTTSNIPVNQK